MTREERAELKLIDTDLLRTALILDGLLRRRARLDSAGTKAFLNGIQLTMRRTIGVEIARKGLEKLNRDEPTS